MSDILPIEPPPSAADERCIDATFCWYARFQQLTSALVRRHRADIARVAEALLRHDTLHYDDIESLVPLRRWPDTWAPPDIALRREQKQELVTLLRLPQRRLHTALGAPMRTLKNNPGNRS
jgi:hypothetical protein